ncbi:hypothetical protein AB3S75_019008 [Citrus x aurantiifolia]
MGVGVSDPCEFFALCEKPKLPVPMPRGHSPWCHHPFLGRFTASASARLLSREKDRDTC